MKIKHITPYLFESYKDAQAKFSQEAPEDEVQQYLNTFKQLANKGTVSGQKKDIGYWIKQRIEQSMDINKAPEDVQIKLIETDPHNIKYINDPSIDYQLRAVSKDGHSIQHINNPSGMVQIAAINSKPNSLFYMDKPSKKAVETFDRLQSEKQNED